MKELVNTTQLCYLFKINSQKKEFTVKQITNYTFLDDKNI